MRDVVLAARTDHSIRKLAAGLDMAPSVLHRQISGPGPVLVSGARPCPKRDRITPATPLAS
jgi:hypothetical protein